MQKCLACNSPAYYVGFSSSECTNPRCQWYFPSVVSCTPNGTPLYPKQSFIREQAVTAREVHLVWGQGSGKSFLSHLVCLDLFGRIKEDHIPIIAVVGVDEHSAMLSFVRPVQELFVTHQEKTGVLLNPMFYVSDASEYSCSETFVDAVFIDEADYLTQYASYVCDKARDLAPFVFSSSSPSYKESSYMKMVQGYLSNPVPGVVVDYATTFEVNTSITRKYLAEYEKNCPEQFLRNFMVFKKN